MKEHFIEILEYNFWANEKAIESVAGLGKKDESLLKLTAHTIATPLYWLSRITDYKLPVNEQFPLIELDEIKRLNTVAKEGWENYLIGLEDDDMRRTITYKNMKGEEYSNLLKDILTHLAMHSAYHRGQIAKAVRKAGGTPASTDYITFKKALLHTNA